jgi:hypothetical protein
MNPAPAAYFALRIGETGLVDVQPVAAPCSKPDGCCGGCAQGVWVVSAQYLQQVVADPETYINNPAKIDWEWLQA